MQDYFEWPIDHCREGKVHTDWLTTLGHIYTGGIYRTAGWTRYQKKLTHLGFISCSWGGHLDQKKEVMQALYLSVCSPTKSPLGPKGTSGAAKGYKFSPPYIPQNYQLSATVTLCPSAALNGWYSDWYQLDSQIQYMTVSQLAKTFGSC